MEFESSLVVSLWVIVAVCVVASIILYVPSGKKPLPVAASFSFTKVISEDGSERIEKTEGGLPSVLDGRVLQAVKGDQLAYELEGWMDGEMLVALGVRVPVNVATKEDLVAVPGINKRVAEAIVKGREALGKYQSWEELARIKGVGPKTLEVLHHSVLLNSVPFEAEAKKIRRLNWLRLLMPWKAGCF